MPRELIQDIQTPSWVSSSFPLNGICPNNSSQWPGAHCAQLVRVGRVGGIMVWPARPYGVTPRRLSLGPQGCVTETVGKPNRGTHTVGRSDSGPDRSPHFLWYLQKAGVTSSSRGRLACQVSGWQSSCWPWWSGPCLYSRIAAERDYSQAGLGENLCTRMRVSECTLWSVELSGSTACSYPLLTFCFK